MNKIYFATKFQSYPLVRQIRDEWKDIHFTNRWQMQPGMINDSKEEAVKFWQDDFDDISRAQALICYAPPDVKLVGALVEAGFALAQNKKVIVVGDHSSYGTWQYHPNVIRAENLEQAHAIARTAHARDE